MGLGMPEVVLILVIALIVFGPRKLPDLGKSLGQAMAQFRRASDDFKRTWEQEVELDKVKGSTGSDYSSSPGSEYGSNDPYNPYADEPATAQLPEAGQDQTVESAPVDGAKTEPGETVPAGATTVQAKQHWI